MVIDCRINRIANYELLSFLNDIGCSGMQFQLLRFWGRHPRAKLSLYAIAYALDAAKISLRLAIKSLVEKGILFVQHSGNGLTTYALNNDQRTQKYIDELAKLDWDEAKKMANQLKEGNHPCQQDK